MSEKQDEISAKKLSSYCRVGVSLEADSLPNNLTLGGQIEIDKLYIYLNNEEFELPFL